MSDENNEWMREWMERKYQVVRVFYDLDELIKAVRHEKIEGPVGIVYHAIHPARFVGQSSLSVEEEKTRIRARLKPLGVEVIVLVSFDTFMERFK